MNGLSPVRALVGAAPHQGSRPRACTSRAKAVGCVARRPWEPYVAVTAAPEAPVRTPLPPRAPRGPALRLATIPAGTAAGGRRRRAEHPEKRSPAPAHGASAAAARRAREVHLRPAPSGAAHLVFAGWFRIPGRQSDPVRASQPVAVDVRAVPSVHDRVLPAVGVDAPVYWRLHTAQAPPAGAVLDAGYLPECGRVPACLR